MKMIALASAVALMAAISTPTFAQDAQPHVIGGVTVPEAEVEAVQLKCDELRAAAGSTTAAAPAAEAPAATTEAPATTAEAPAATTEAPATDAATTTEPTIDLATLTIEMCDEGAFTASAQ